MNSQKKLHRAGFTLIELLVVISIIAILAGMAMPVYTSVIMNGKMTAASAKARQIGIAMMVYAQDNGEVFPSERNSYDEPIQSSNDAFRSLIPAYLGDERVFAVPGAKVGATADNRIDSPAKMLERNENHWAYVAGLSPTSNSAWPLIVDQTDGAGSYSTLEGDPSGLWKGTKTIVVHVDNSANIVPLLGTGKKRYLPRSDDKNKNALDTDYMGQTIKLLEPAA